MEALSNSASAGKPTIALVGFMGAGKSTAARTLGTSLDEPWADSDLLFEERSGMPIPQFFEQRGEAEFRAEEERLALELLAKGGIVALGGGAVESDAVRAALRDCVCVWCQVDEEIAWERAARSDRPLAQNRDEFAGRLGAREPLYEEVARAVVPTERRETVAAAAPWIEALRPRPGLQLVWATARSGSYPAMVGPGATETLAVAQRRRFAVADAAALEKCGALLPEPHEVSSVPGGEESKTLEEAAAVLGWLAARGARRDDGLIAFGGGVIGDLAGFCAAVYQRGIPVVQIPTTLVAQVDSAYGGKTGVDIPEAKNYVGAYHQPEAVLTDPAALETLPSEELAAGYAEVVKTALLVGGDLWERVRALGAPTTESVAPLIFDCVRFKVAVVADDERDSGRREILNLGHTVGHAIEQASGYSRYRHGEAVGLGLLAALRISGSDDLRREVEELLSRAGLPIRLDAEIPTEAIEQAMGRDKKARAEGVRFVALERPGDPTPGQLVEADIVRAAVEELR